MDKCQRLTALIEKGPNLDSLVVTPKCRVGFHHTLVDLANGYREKNSKDVGCSQSNANINLHRNLQEGKLLVIDLRNCADEANN